MHRRWPIWNVETTATVVRSSDTGTRTAERYLTTIRSQRRLSSIVALSIGERLERDRFSGIDFRSTADLGLSWAVVRTDQWTVDALTTAAWNHERRRFTTRINDPIGQVQMLSRLRFGASGQMTGRVTMYLDFADASAYRSEAEVNVQAAMISYVALKLGYLARYSNAPVPGFGRLDNTATASVVLHWRADMLAPPQ